MNTPLIPNTPVSIGAAPQIAAGACFRETKNGELPRRLDETFAEENSPMDAWYLTLGLGFFLATGALVYLFDQL